MCPKLFILKEFYFLILESNVRLHKKYSSKWVIKYKTKKSRINESWKKKSASQLKKMTIYILYLIISIQIFLKS